MVKTYTQLVSLKSENQEREFAYLQDREDRGKRGLYVYAELGVEQEYIPSPNDNPMTEYRIFSGCDVYFAKTKEQLANGDFEAEYLPNVTAIVYC